MPVSYFFVVVPNIKVMFCCLAIDKGFFYTLLCLNGKRFHKQVVNRRKGHHLGSHHHGLYEVLCRVNCRWIQTLYNLYEIRGPIASIANSLKSTFFFPSFPKRRRNSLMIVLKLQTDLNEKVF